MLSLISVETILRWLATLNKFTAIFYKGDNFFNFLFFLSCKSKPFWKGVHFKRKEFAPHF